jgi:hypothetical protein
MDGAQRSNLHRARMGGNTILTRGTKVAPTQNKQHDNGNNKNLANTYLRNYKRIDNTNARRVTS